MARDEAPPFARGETITNDFSGNTALAEWNDTVLGPAYVNLEGKEFVFEANSQDSESGFPVAATQNPNGHAVRVKVVRNRSGVNLKPARLVHFDETATAYPALAGGTNVNLETGVDGYTFALADSPAGVVDEFLPAAGVPPYDLFYVVIDGPTLFTNKGTAATILRGSRLIPATGTSRTNDDSGRVDLQDLTGATATLAENIQNAVGIAGLANAVNSAQFKGLVHRISKL